MIINAFYVCTPLLKWLYNSLRLIYHCDYWYAFYSFTYGEEFTIHIIVTLKTKGVDMDLQLKDKLALVTGSTAGIGYAISEVFAKEGAKVIINGRSQKQSKMPSPN